MMDFIFIFLKEPPLHTGAVFCLLRGLNINQSHTTSSRKRIDMVDKDFIAMVRRLLEQAESEGKAGGAFARALRKYLDKHDANTYTPTKHHAKQ